MRSASSTLGTLQARTARESQTSTACCSCSHSHGVYSGPSSIRVAAPASTTKMRQRSSGSIARARTSDEPAEMRRCAHRWFQGGPEFTQ
eukprot:120060-Prymnesium_polylepis.1